jgi:hypothetical protein
MPGNNPFLHQTPAQFHFAVDDPVGGLEHSLPIHPDQGSSKPMEYWEDQLHKKRSRKPTPKPSPGNSPQDDRQIDDYA